LDKLFSLPCNPWRCREAGGAAGEGAPEERAAPADGEDPATAPVAEGASTAPVAGQEAAEAEDAAPAAEGASAAPVAGQEAAEAEDAAP